MKHPHSPRKSPLPSEALRQAREKQKRTASPKPAPEPQPKTEPEAPNGVLGFHCLDASCFGKGWNQLRELFEPKQHSEPPREDEPEAAPQPQPKPKPEAPPSLCVAAQIERLLRRFLILTKFEAELLLEANRAARNADNA
jgi:hypothetical protein